MKLILLILAILLALTTSGNVPFNDVRFLNDTLLREYVEKHLASDPATGWTKQISGQAEQRQRSSIWRLKEQKPEFLCRDNDGKWRRKMPADTVEIRSATKDEGSLSSTTGYISSDLDSTAGRHLVVLKYDRMVHEHQRYDRDTYVNFDCTKLEGYDAAKKYWDEHHANMGWPSMEIICASDWMARYYLKWNAPAEYSKEMGSFHGVKNPQYFTFEYDHQSIMTYDS
ncbi:hypothetical protein CC86DRAFT_400206 [Ophiobolus disseminans]|uniref:Uncharacterized protein n=1 Tax=Ophiobolus disseminans TaxID=1469910 RepID=A0A6A7ALN4_9PLEO|nr:hypothetical protein CC86DRAFT_400206 [Ophiobolus disseminans]